MQITWYGHSAFRLDFGGNAVLIDPFFTGNPAFVSDPREAMRGVKHVVLTHGHADHVGDALISAAGMRAIAAEPRWWSPKGLTPELARTEGWTFGVA